MWCSLPKLHLLSPSLVVLLLLPYAVAVFCHRVEHHAWISESRVILLTAPPPAVACCFLPVHGQSGAIKTAGSTPGPILRTTAPTRTLTDAKLRQRSGEARRYLSFRRGWG